MNRVSKPTISIKYVRIFGKKQDYHTYEFCLHDVNNKNG